MSTVFTLKVRKRKERKGKRDIRREGGKKDIS